MTNRALIRISAYAALLAGALRIVAALLSPAALGEATELLYLVIDLALLLALLGVYLGRHEALGRLGFVGFAIALPALAIIVGPDGQMLGLDVYRVGGALLIVGIGVLAIAQARARLDRQWSSVLWLGSLGMLVVAAVQPQAVAPFVALGTLFGAGFVAAGFEGLREGT